ncbi:MAG: hypothetical protein QOK39_1246 [Acidimicrobiaceae bacterium]|jgi:uncharacterized membrane protein|nr:hypothetical protein [Acidimicrobiaceae bacterium]
MTPARRFSGPALAGMLLATGAAHFAIPRFYDAIVPGALPGGPRPWVLASGGAELACAALVANRRTRSLGATLCVVLFVAVFPANVKMAFDWSHQGRLKAAIAIVRLPLQLPLIYWALVVRRRAVATHD